MIDKNYSFFQIQFKIIKKCMKIKEQKAKCHNYVSLNQKSSQSYTYFDSNHLSEKFDIFDTIFSVINNSSGVLNNEKGHCCENCRL